MKTISILEKSVFLGFGALWCGVDETPDNEKVAICQFGQVTVYRTWNSVAGAAAYTLEVTALGIKCYEVYFSPWCHQGAESAARTAAMIAKGGITFRKYDDS